MVLYNIVQPVLHIILNEGVVLMSEYKDIKNNVYPIIQKTLDSDESEKERILDALYAIFKH